MPEPKHIAGRKGAENLWFLRFETVLIAVQTEKYKFLSV